jgi:hypothetical protein
MSLVAPCTFPWGVTKLKPVKAAWESLFNYSKIIWTNLDIKESNRSKMSLLTYEAGIHLAGHMHVRTRFKHGHTMAQLCHGSSNMHGQFVFTFVFDMGSFVDEEAF